MARSIVCAPYVVPPLRLSHLSRMRPLLRKSRSTRPASPEHQKARWLHSAMSAAEWSPPCAEQSPAISARMSSPLLLASIRSISSSSPMQPADISRATSSKRG